MISLKWGHIVWGVGLSVVLCYSIACAEEPAPPPPPPPPPWSGSFNFGLTAASGDSRSYSGNVSADAKYKNDPSELRATASVVYGKSDGSISTSKAMGTVHYSYLFTERVSGYLAGGVERDGLADLNFRVTVGPGAGYYFIKRPDATLVGELGVNYFSDKFLNQSTKNYLTMRVAERGEWKISGTAKFWETANFFPALNNLATDFHYLLMGEVGLETTVTTHTTMRFVVQDSYDSEPASGRRPNDTTYLATIGYKF
jgi:putative salt-induced outer membrane protein YdiY